MTCSQFVEHYREGHTVLNKAINVLIIASLALVQFTNAKEPPLTADGISTLAPVYLGRIHPGENGQFIVPVSLKLANECSIVDVRRSCTCTDLHLIGGVKLPSNAAAVFLVKVSTQASQYGRLDGAIELTVRTTGEEVVQVIQPYFIDIAKAVDFGASESRPYLISSVDTTHKLAGVNRTDHRWTNATARIQTLDSKQKWICAIEFGEIDERGQGFSIDISEAIRAMFSEGEDGIVVPKDPIATNIDIFATSGPLPLRQVASYSLDLLSQSPVQLQPKVFTAGTTESNYSFHVIAHPSFPEISTVDVLLENEKLPANVRKKTGRWFQVSLSNDSISKEVKAMQVRVIVQTVDGRRRFVGEVAFKNGGFFDKDQE